MKGRAPPWSPPVGNIFRDEVVIRDFEPVEYSTILYGLCRELWRISLVGSVIETYAKVFLFKKKD